MKKLLLISSILFSLISTLFSQTPYYKMLGDTNRWFVSGYFLGVKPSGIHNTTNIGSPCVGYYEATKDSVYNSKIYKVFKQDQIIVCAWISGPQLFEALIREDTVMKKIYVVHPDSVNECVAMDFGMTVGDSIYLPYSPNSSVLKNGYYKLDSIINKAEVLGQRQHFYLSKYDAPINFLTGTKYYIEWIESMGATHFPINIIEEEQSNDFSMPFSCKRNQYTTYVTCKHTNGIKHYQDSCALKFVNTHSGYVLFGDNCEFYGFTGRVKELSFLNDLLIFPNPSSLTDQLTLKFKALIFKPFEIIIYNTLGQKVYSDKVNITTTDNEIKLTDLKLMQGLYTLQLKSDDESSTINFIRN
jgi:hypothetical protein